MWALATLAVAGYGLATAMWQLMLASLAFNLLETAGTIVWATMKQRHVPGHLLGRVSSLDWLISIGLLPRVARADGAAERRAGRAHDADRRGRCWGRWRRSADWLLPGMRAVDYAWEGPRGARAGGSAALTANTMWARATPGTRALDRPAVERLQRDVGEREEVALGGVEHVGYAAAVAVAGEHQEAFDAVAGRLHADALGGAPRCSWGPSSKASRVASVECAVIAPLSGLGLV